MTSDWSGTSYAQPPYAQATYGTGNRRRRTATQTGYDDWALPLDDPDRVTNARNPYRSDDQTGCTSAPNHTISNDDGSNKSGWPNAGVIIPGITGPNHYISQADPRYATRFEMNPRLINQFKPEQIAQLPGASGNQQFVEVSIRFPNGSTAAAVSWQHSSSTGEWLSGGSMRPGDHEKFRAAPGDSIKFFDLLDS